MKIFAVLCGVTFAVSAMVGCAAPAEEATGAIDASEADLTGTGSPTGAVDPTVTSPVAWACNFTDGSSAVFVQERVHSAYGTLARYDGAQEHNAGFATVSTGSGLEAVSTTRVKFKQVDMAVTFTAVEEEGAPVAMSVAMDEELRIGRRLHPWTARLPNVDAIGGCWGVR